MTIDYFPLGTAEGGSFCNRINELSHMVGNIELCKPTLIMSPRRYGKTSLALRALKKSQKIYAFIDLYKEIDELDVARAIIGGVGHILGQIEPRAKQLMRLAADFFSDLQISFSMGQVGMTAELQNNLKPADKIQKVLQKLNQLAAKLEVKVVLFIDEFQKLGDIAGYAPIEAAIRHEAQLAKNVVYIFSGNNRHLIENMFFDSSRPFYKLCDTIHLQRIASEHYNKYIAKAAEKKWQQEISKEAIDKILELTERHSYYVNLLCSKLWRGKLPDEKLVISAWRECVLENKSQIERELDLLSLNQKKIVMGISKYGAVNQPTGKDFLNKINISSTSASMSVAKLIDLDYLYIDNNGLYRLLDPMQSYMFSSAL